jgi:hypothetical protein
MTTVSFKTSVVNGLKTPKARVVFYDTGHFALETHASEIGQEILTFLKANL